MGKIIDLALSGAFCLVVTTAAFADSKSIAEFVLNTCLPALEQLSKVDIPCTYPPKGPKMYGGSTDWEAMKRGEIYSVIIWNNESAGDLPTCVANFHQTKNINRDDFFASISAALKLKLESDQTNPRMRTEEYSVTGGSGTFLFRLISHLDGGMVISLIAFEPAAPRPESDSCFWLRRRLTVTSAISFPWRIRTFSHKRNGAGLALSELTLP